MLAFHPEFAGTKHVYPLKQLRHRTPAPVRAEGEATEEKIAEIICQAILFDGGGHGCGGFCQAKARFGKAAQDVLAALKAEDSLHG